MKTIKQRNEKLRYKGLVFWSLKLEKGMFIFWLEGGKKIYNYHKIKYLWLLKIQYNPLTFLKKVGIIFINILNK